MCSKGVRLLSSATFFLTCRGLLPLFESAELAKSEDARRDRKCIVLCHAHEDGQYERKTTTSAAGNSRFKKIHGCTYPRPRHFLAYQSLLGTIDCHRGTQCNQDSGGVRYPALPGSEGGRREGTMVAWGTMQAHSFRRIKVC